MKRFFNVAGPCFKTMHYMIEASTRLQGVEQLVEMGQYFVIHASRQSGKTTCLKDLTSRLNAAGEYYTLYCSLESLQGVADAEKGVPGILDSLVMALENSAVPFQYDECYEQDKRNRPLVVLTQFLSELSRSLDKRLVIFLDEADCLSESTLIAFLRQLRSGYNNRDVTPFIYSLALVGMRNIRDYKVHIRPDRESLGSASPFNIVTESLTLKNFTRAEIAGLYGQHT
ncbi:MAG: ATP-binding protein, partial [Acidobacteriota bacterium]|nr:ATP-binding protein [Acidobacteriota bacterium]